MPDEKAAPFPLHHSAHDEDAHDADAHDADATSNESTAASTAGEGGFRSGLKGTRGMAQTRNC